MIDLPTPSDESAQVRALAHEYDEAPAYPSRNRRILRTYWEDYAEWVQDRARYLCGVFKVKECRYEAYEGGEDLRADALRGRLVVTKDYAPHPLFDLETNQAIRIVHDLDGHASTGRGFSWVDEVSALREQARRTPPKFLPALFAQTLHQLSSTTHNKQFPDEQKLVLTEHQEWRAVLLGTGRALPQPIQAAGHEECADCDVPHPHSHTKENNGNS